MSTKITLKTTKGPVTFDADDCELLTVVVNGDTHEVKQPHISNYLANHDLQRKAAEQFLESNREIDKIMNEQVASLRGRQ